MSRSSNGKYKTGESNRLDLRVLLQQGQIKKGFHLTGNIEWTNGSSIAFESKYTKDEVYFRVAYSITDYRTGKETNYDYKINFVKIPSNLGKGEILYFVCPESGRRARVLFMAYRHHKYIHRDWYLDRYGVRLYYNSQSVSKNDYHNTIYFNYDSKIKDLEYQLSAKYRKIYYKGKPTKDYQRLINLNIKKEFHNVNRLATLSNCIRLMKNKL